MNLQELFENLSYGPLSELPIGGEGYGMIPEKEWGKVILRVNNAILALYARFPLLVKTLTIETVTGLHQYPLRKEYAQTSGSNQMHKFIKDTPDDPFLGDVLMIQGMKNEHYDVVAFNDDVEREPEDTWFMSGYDVLSYSHPATPRIFYVEYRAAPPKIAFDLVKPEEEKINIPPVLETALMHHIAGNIYGNMSIEGAMAKSQNHLATYEGECQYHEEANTFGQWSARSKRDIRREGWV